MNISFNNATFRLISIWSKWKCLGFSIGTIETMDDLRSLLSVDYNTNTKEFVVCVLFRYWTFDLSK